MNEQYNLNGLLFESAMNGNFSEIKRLLTSPNLDIKADIHFFNDSCLTLACERGELEIIRYLLTSPELEEHAHLHADNYQPFKALCVNNQLSVIHYLIFDLNLELNEELEFYLNKDSVEIGQTVKSLFEKKEAVKNLKDELNNNLPTNLEKINNKIKI